SDVGAGAQDARVCDHGAYPAYFRPIAAGRGGIAVPGAAPDGAGRVGAGGVGEDGKEPGGAILFDHAEGAAAARTRAAELAAADGRGCARARGGAVVSWAGRIRNALRPGRAGREIEKELACHLTEKIEELQASGMSEAEALRAAQRQIGNPTYQAERTRDVDINQRVEATL